MSKYILTKAEAKEKLEAIVNALRPPHKHRPQISTVLQITTQIFNDLQAQIPDINVDQTCAALGRRRKYCRLAEKGNLATESCRTGGEEGRGVSLSRGLQLTAPGNDLFHGNSCSCRRSGPCHQRRPFQKVHSEYHRSEEICADLRFATLS